MLQLYKNGIVTAVAKSQISIRQMEVDWYCNNYGMITGQAAMLAGFAFGQLTTPMPETHGPSFILECSYLFATCFTIGLELSAIIMSTFLSVWAPYLALRGSNGTADLHKAVDCLRDYQLLVFSYFVVGWVVFFVSSILQLWIYFRRRVALVVTAPMAVFVILILYYIHAISMSLGVDQDEVVAGKIDAFQTYECIGDIDRGLTEGNGAVQNDGEGYCPIHENRDSNSLR